MKSNAVVEIFTDGACSGNPGIGGYAAILKKGSVVKEISGAERFTTNNRMELMAVISALKALKKPCNLIVTTDSNYVVKGITEWIKGWLKNNWKNSQNKEVLNKDLWLQLYELSKEHNIKWQWIKGHNGHEQNERCDYLAREAIKNYEKN